MQIYFPFWLGLGFGFGFIYVFLFEGREYLKDLKNLRKNRTSIFIILFFIYIVWGFIHIPIYPISVSSLATNWTFNLLAVSTCLFSSLLLFGMINFPKKKTRNLEDTISYSKALLISILTFFNFRFFYWCYNAFFISHLTCNALIPSFVNIGEYFSTPIAILLTFLGFSVAILFGMIQRD